MLLVVLTVLALNRGNVAYLLDVEESRHTRHQALAKCRVAGEDVCEAALLDVLHQQRSIVLWQALVVCSVINVYDLFKSVHLCYLFRNAHDVRSSYYASDAAANLGACSDCCERRRVQFAITLLQHCQCRSQPRKERLLC